MSQHIWLRKKLTKHNHVFLHYWAKDPGNRISRNGDPVLELAYCMERFTQGGREDPRLRARRGKHGRKTDAMAYDVLGDLLFAPAHVQTIEQWLNLHPDDLKRRLITVRDKQLIQIVKSRLQTIFNIPPHTADYTCRIKFMYSNMVSRRDFWLAWRRYNRGRDFFVNGLGSFDLTAAPIKEFLLKGDISRPSQITALGYLIKNVRHWRNKGMRTVDSLDLLLRTQPAYTVQHFPAVIQLMENNTLDELARAFASFPVVAQNEYVVPEQELTAKLNTPPLQLVEQRREYRNRHLPRLLERVPDTFEYPVKQYGEWKCSQAVFSPIHTYGELKEVASQLKNCAVNYHEAISNKASVLIVMKEPGSEKPLALGEWSPKTNSWQQIAGSCNKDLTSKQDQLFSSYAKRITNP